MLKNYSEKHLLWLIMLFAAATRFYNYAQWSLTNDELSALLGYSYGSLYNNITQYVSTDFHPAGVQVLLFFWCTVFGTSEISLRFPFVVMGILSVFLVYKTSEKWFNTQVALLCSATIAVSQFAILYSQIARPYGSGLFFVLFCLWGWNGFVFLKDNDKVGIKNIILFISGMVLSMYNHYFSFLMVAIIGFFGLFLVPKSILKSYIICGLIAVVLFLPHLGITIKQFTAGGLGWLSPPDSSYFATYLQYIFNQSWGYFIFIIGIAVLAIYKTPPKAPNNKWPLIALSWFLIPLITAYLYSLYVSPVLQHSILIFSFPFVLFFIFSCTPPQKQKRLLFLIPFILLVGTIQIYALNKFNGSNEFARFKEIAQHINMADEEYGASQITRAINVTDSSYINYYLKRYHHNYPFSFYHNAGREDAARVLEIVEQAQTPYFMYCWSNSDCPPEINQIIQSKYPYLIERYLYFNCEYYLYSKKSVDIKRALKTNVKEFNQDYKVSTSFFSTPSTINIDSSLKVQTPFAEYLSNKTEYSSTFRIKLKDLVKSSSDIIEAFVKIKPEDNHKDLLLVFSINQGDENYFWSGVNIKSFFKNPMEWDSCYGAIRLPIIKSADDVLSVYIFNQGKGGLWIRDFKVKSVSGNENLYGKRKDAALFEFSSASH